MNNSLKNHVLSLHEKEKPYFEEKGNRNRHMKTIWRKTYEQNNPFQCKACTERFSQKADLIGHITSVHEGIKLFKMAFQCSNCGEGFLHNDKFQEHISSVHERPECFIYRVSHGKVNKVIWLC